MLANLTKRNKELKQLTYTTSHDLRAPVNSFLSIFSLIDTSRINDTETSELMEIVKSAGERLRQTLNNYVDNLSEKYSAHVNVEEEMIDLNESLNEVLQSINALIQTSKTTIHIDFSQLNKIKFNIAYLESVFLNLITNAIKYSRPGYPPIISIFSRKIDGVSQLVIADNGLGFDMEKVKDKIFGLHQKFHDHTESKGIGLYLVHTHITSLGGKISVESKINEGAKFIISFK